MTASDDEGDEPGHTEAIPADVLRAARGPTLESISPSDAVERYLDDKTREARPTTVDSHRSRLSFFVEWCEEQDVDNLNDLSARDLHDFRVWRRDDGDLSVTTEKTNQDTLRAFVRWCESIDAVPPGLHEAVQSPTIAPGADARDTMLAHDDAEEILGHLAKYEYATAEHVAWLLLARTGARVATVHSLDVDDFEGDATPPHVTVEHRPETGTRLKNGEQGERKLAFDMETATVIEDYLADQRPDVTDGYGRKPLLASGHGRLTKSTIRKYVYKWSRPCTVTGRCPHDREIDACDAAKRADLASKCPSSVSPHPVRRGYITKELQAGAPRFAVSDRCDVSEAVIETHYDERSETERMQQRKEIFDEVHGRERGDARAGTVSSPDRTT